MLYEVVVIVRPELSGQQAEALVRSFESVLSQQGGVLDALEYSGLRPLAYPIRKYAKGHYLLMCVTSSASAIHEVCRLMRLNEDVLRFLNTKVDQHPTLPSPLAQYRHDRDYDHTPAPAAEDQSSETLLDPSPMQS